MLLFGPDEGRKHRRLSLNFTPCEWGKNNCSRDLKKIKSYIGDAVLTLYHNTQRMNLKEYGDRSIVHESVIKNT